MLQLLAENVNKANRNTRKQNKKKWNYALVCESDQKPLSKIENEKKKPNPSLGAVQRLRTALWVRGREDKKQKAYSSECSLGKSIFGVRGKAIHLGRSFSKTNYVFTFRVIFLHLAPRPVRQCARISTTLIFWEVLLWSALLALKWYKSHADLAHRKQ